MHYAYHAESHLCLEETCILLGTMTGEEWELSDLLGEGMTPAFWVEPRYYSRSIYYDDDAKRPYWARIAFPEKRELMVEGGKALVSAFRTPADRLVRVQSRFAQFPMYTSVALRDLAFCWGDLEDAPWKYDRPPIRVVSAAAARAKTTASEITKASRHQLQEQRILELLRQQGLDPLNLPPRSAGRAGPKSIVKTAASNEPQLFTPKSFETAWERLRSGGRLIGAE